jgi:hypothetical protein
MNQPKTPKADALRAMREQKMRDWEAVQANKKKKAGGKKRRPK